MSGARRFASGYVTVGLLARGGMGEVLLGMRRTESFRRLVAIKRLRPEHRGDPSFRRMFLDEAKIAGLIRHPNVVSVLDVGDDDDGPFLVMDFIESVTVNAMIKALVSEGEQVPVQVAARIVAQVAHGLSAAHELRNAEGTPVRVIHRDISPQNILLGFDGVARLTDFGIAKATTSSQNTTTGLLKGKVGYMSPEQLRFERPTQRSDLFSLGVVLFELLSGRRLYAGSDTVAVAQKILLDPTPDIFAVRDDVPPALIELSFELLAKDPADRPESAYDVAKRLDALVDDLTQEEGALRLEEFLRSQFFDEWEDIKTRSESMIQEWEQSASRRTRQRRGWIVAIAAGVLILGAVGAWMAQPDPDRDPEPEPSPTATATPTPTPTPDPDPARDPDSDPDPDPDPASASASASASDSDANADDRRPRMRRIPRMRDTMASMTSMDEFNALDLIRGGH